MADLDLTNTHVRVIVPTVTAVTVALPEIPNVAVLPVAGPPGATVVVRDGADPDMPDLTLLFENALL